MTDRLNSNNTTGYTGVYRWRGPSGKPWYAAISIDGRWQRIAYFATPEEAAAAYREAREEFPRRRERQSGHD